MFFRLKIYAYRKYKSAQYVHSYLLYDTASYARVHQVCNGELSYWFSVLSLTASLDICCANWYRADTASIYSGNEPVTASYHACSGAESGKTGEASKSAAVFTPVDNDILDGPFFCNYTIASQFVVVKKRNAKNVKNKNKKRFQKKLSQPERLGELKLYRLIWRIGRIRPVGL